MSTAVCPGSAASRSISPSRLLRHAHGPRCFGHQFDQRLADQPGFAGTGNARHRGEHAERDIDIEIVRLLRVIPAQLKPSTACARRGRHAHVSANRYCAVCEVSTLRKPCGGPL